uniref:Uncharacterized protein n=1 Tax=Romanomermis culicivorax TaxID=13658 RepID=A0A915JCL5_ROMCU
MCPLYIEAKIEYVPRKENTFADFFSRKYEVDQTDSNKPTASSQNNTTNRVNVVKTRAKSRQKLAQPPQNDVGVPEMPDKEKIVDPSDLPNQNQWPFTQQQIADAQKVETMLDQTRQKVENQYLLFENLTNIHNKVLKELQASEAASKKRFDEKARAHEYTIAETLLVDIYAMIINQTGFNVQCKETYCNFFVIN